MENNEKNIQVELKKGEYFNYGQRYFTTFKYNSDEQKRKIYDVFENALVPTYGANSHRSREGKAYIMPYFADEKGNMTTENTGIIGGTSIPEDLLPEFIRRFVEVDEMTAKIGDEKISGEFDYDKFEKYKGKLLENLSIEELEALLQKTNDDNQTKREELRKRELIAQIRAAQEEGQKLDEQLSAENARTNDEREE